MFTTHAVVKIEEPDHPNNLNQLPDQELQQPGASIKNFETFNNSDGEQSLLRESSDYLENMFFTRGEVCFNHVNALSGEVSPQARKKSVFEHIANI